MRKTYFPRLAIRAVQVVERIRDREYEMEFALPVLFTVIASFIATILLFCIGVQLVNEMMK